MAEKIIMPKQGLQMTEGTITKWLVKEGGTVKEGEPLFEIETDKVVIVIDSPVSGSLLYIAAPEGATVPITELIAVVGKPGEDISGLLHSAAGEGTDGDRVFVSPRAKTQAAKMGIDYTKLEGSAPDGMIIERDVLAVKHAPARAEPLTEIVAESNDIVPMHGMRKMIAERMKQSLDTNAQTIHRVSVRMGEIVRLREALNVKISFNDLIAYATAKALQEYPAINAELTDKGIWRKRFVNLGIAVALEEGLIVPVVKSAEKLSLVELSAEIKRLAEKARNGKLRSDEFTGGSFTISNLGMFGLEEFVAILNPPESGILAVGKIEDTPIAINGAAEIHPVMKLTLSYDHRVVDGAPAAQFLVRIKEFLEYPYLLVLQ